MPPAPKSSTWQEPTTKDPAELLKMQLIPPHRLRHIPKDMKPGLCDHAQRNAIRVILNLRKDVPFKRCRGTRTDGERCKQVAGEGTKGDFYGLGPQTGTLGVGFCANCIKHHHIRIGAALQMARNEVKQMQQYGVAAVDTDYSKKLAKQEVALAVQNIKEREEVQLVKTTLTGFQKMLDDVDEEKHPTEMSQGHAVPMCDKTRVSLLLDIAKTLSKLNVDSIKLDETKYIQIDHVLAAFEEFKQSRDSGLRMVEELTIQKSVKGEEVESGETPVVDYVIEISNADCVASIRRLQAKVGRG